MNLQMRDVTVTHRQGKVSAMSQVYLRGSHIRFVIVPDMLRYVCSVLQAMQLQAVAIPRRD